MTSFGATRGTRGDAEGFYLHSTTKKLDGGIKFNELKGSIFRKSIFIEPKMASS